MAPLFRLSQDWHLIRMITNIVTYVLMLASYFYMMKPLKVDRRWVALTGAVLLLPFSETMMTHMQMGNTYMPHVILLFFYLGLFLRLVQKVAYPRWRRWEMAAVYLSLPADGRKSSPPPCRSPASGHGRTYSGPPPGDCGEVEDLQGRKRQCGLLQRLCLQHAGDSSGDVHANFCHRQDRGLERPQDRRADPFRSKASLFRIFFR